MPEVPVLKERKVIAGFRHAGFVYDRQVGSHYIMVHPETNGTAVIPRHGRDIPKGTLKAIVTGAGLTMEEFLRHLR